MARKVAGGRDPCAEWPEEQEVLAATIDLLRVVDASVIGVVMLLGLAREVAEWAGGSRRGKADVAERLSIPRELEGLKEAESLIDALRRSLGSLDPVGGGVGGEIREGVGMNFDHG